MKSTQYHLVDIDEDLGLTREINGQKIYSARQGTDYETKPQEGVIAVGHQKDNSVKEGDTIIFSHTCCDNRIKYTDQVQYGVLPEQVFAKREGKGLKGITRIVAKEIKREPRKTETGIYLEANSKPVPQLFEVEHSPFPEYKKGDLIYVTEHGDYYIERLDRLFIKPQHVIAIAKPDHEIKELMNTHQLVDMLDERDEFSLVGRIWLPEKNNRSKGMGKVIMGIDKGKTIFYRKRRANKFMYREKEYQAITNDQIFFEV